MGNSSDYRKQGAHDLPGTAQDRGGTEAEPMPAELDQAVCHFIRSPEKELKTTEGYLEKVLEESADGISIVNRHG